ncbi:hypothetical protein ACOI1H_13445 [Loktanella sp. DJP18]|uniref:hypothetical protein n=1 Tax=Loktanella sp. DJP18 TaxID=3409788 RepID=UPI003BB4A5B1
MENIHPEDTPVQTAPAKPGVLVRIGATIAALAILMVLHMCITMLVMRLGLTSPDGDWFAGVLLFIVLNMTIILVIVPHHPKNWFVRLIKTSYWS